MMKGELYGHKGSWPSLIWSKVFHPSLSKTILKKQVHCSLEVEKIICCVDKVLPDCCTEQCKDERWEVTEADLKPGCWDVKWDREEKRIEPQSGNAESRSWRQPVVLRGCKEWTPWILQRGIAISPDNCDIYLSRFLWCANKAHPYWGFIFCHLPCYFLYSLLDSQGDADRISQRFHSQRKCFSDQSWKVKVGFWAGVGK